MSDPDDFTILTAASESFGPSLLALLGSLDRNWPGHPPVRVYDIGLESPTLEVLDKHRIATEKVPEFCPHWRKHWTWKLWCWQHAPTKAFIWLDAGLVVLRPMPEIVEVARKLGYFLISTDQPLNAACSDGALAAAGMTRDDLQNRVCLAATHLAFDRSHSIIDLIVRRCYELSMHEEAIRATNEHHRHDQALVSLLVYREFGEVAVSDIGIYGGYLGPCQSVGQKLWVHRRRLAPTDQRLLADSIGKPPEPFIPGEPGWDRERITWRNAIPRALRHLRTRCRSKRLSAEEQTRMRDGIR